MATQHKVTLNWDAAPSGQTVTGWTIRRQDTASGPFNVIGTSPTNSFVDSDPNLKEGQSYSYECAADNTSGESAESNIVVVTVPFQLPSAPTNLVAKAS